MSHAVKRISERYGVALTKEDMHAICAQIKAGKDAVREQVRRDGTWRVVALYQGRALFCLYNPTRNKLITAFPHGWNDKPMRKLSKRELHQNSQRRDRRLA